MAASAPSFTLSEPYSASIDARSHALIPFHPSLLHHPRFRSHARPSVLRLSSRIRASSAAIIEPEIKSQRNNTLESDPFACPVCYEPLIRKGPPGLNLPAIYRSSFKCKLCNKTYSSKENYLDLTVTAGAKEYTETKPTGTELFRMAQEYFKPAEGGLLVDVSCGSGLFSRKFAQAGTYSGVIALDFSENMLRQCYEFIKKEEALLNSNLALVRADISRLPFQTGTVDAVHAGAALHCWPSPSNAIAEISRVLRSGGVFVGSTFLRYTPTTPPLLRPLREVEFVLKHNKDLSPYLKKCKTLHLGPDILLPQDMMSMMGINIRNDDEDEELDTTANDLPLSSIVDSSSDERMSTSSGSENTSFFFSYAHIVRKKRSGLSYVRSASPNNHTKKKWLARRASRHDDDQ